MTRVIMISTDKKILEDDSSVQVRMKEYGGLFEELHVILFVKKSFHSSFFSFKEPARISSNAFVYPTNSISRFFYIRNAVKLGSQVIKKLDKEGLVVTAQDPFEAGFVGRRLSLRFGVPLHIQIHTDFLSPYFPKGSLLNRIRIILSRKTIAQAKAIRVVSERIKRSLQDARAAVLPIYADISGIHQAPVPVGFKQAHIRFDKTVLMASRLTKEKDLPTALRAFFLALKEHPKAGLLVIGSGPELLRLQDLAASLNVSGRVEWKPWMEKSELISYMKTCDVFLSSSLYEGYGLSLVEAHAAGAVLAATDAGVAPLLAHDKCLAEPRNAEVLGLALSNALSGAFKNKEYSYLYSSKAAYLEAYKKDIERALL
jgi:glycosyltransferase involved in cell wall biosynthesis